MKRSKIFIIGLLTFISCFILIPILEPVNATSIKDRNNFVYYPKDKNLNNYDISIDSSDEIENIRIINNSDPSVAKIKIEKDYDVNLNVKLLKPGNTIVTVEITTNEYSEEGFIECKEEKSFIINSVKYICPIKKFKIGKTEYTSKFKNSPLYKIKKSKAIKNKKLIVKPAKDWKIKKIYLNYIKGYGIMEKTLKNNKCFSSPKTGEIIIVMYNTKLEITEELYIDL